MRRSILQSPEGLIRGLVSGCRSAGLVLLGVGLFTGPAVYAAEPAAMPALRTLQVGIAQPDGRASYDGTVEAVRQSMIAAQVAGTIVELPVAAGDAVRSGQLLVRLDAREASQGTVAAGAQLAAARARLNLARQEYERQQQLFAKRYISAAAMEQAQAAFESAQAEVNSQMAQTGIARTQQSFNVVTAPYAGIVAELKAEVGDIALPGKVLMTLYDPAELRVSVALPQSLAAAIDDDAVSEMEIRIAGRPAAVKPLRMQLLPVADPRTHTRTLRLTLPAAVAGVRPGMFARVSLPSGLVPAMQDAGPGVVERIMVPVGAVVRRAEMTGLYVISASGRPLLRQVRLGAVQGDQVEVLAGLSGGEIIALDPQVAAVRR